MILLYRIVYLPALVIAMPYYLFRMWRRGGYRKGFSNRFGYTGAVPEKKAGVKRIWIQAVSVGELLAIGPLLKSLEKNPSVEIILTTTTSTGYRVLEDKYASITRWHGIFPMDFWLFSKRAWDRLKPDMAILMEGELWPEHIHQSFVRNIPVLLVNARLSDRSFRRHEKMKSVIRPLLGKLSRILASSETDLERFNKLGWLPKENIHLTGNLKLDLNIGTLLSDDERSAMLQELGFLEGPSDSAAPFILVGSSTWHGEEAALLEVFKALRPEFPQLRLLVVPRHAERRKELEALLQGQSFQFHFRSDGNRAPDGTQVYVADTTGELRMLTQLADLVMIGKSFPPNAGGQTPVEAAALGKPLVFGPDMSNFRDITRRLVRTGAAKKLTSVSELETVIRELMMDAQQRIKMGRLAHAFIEESHGATGKTCQAIMDFIQTD